MTVDGKVIGEMREVFLRLKEEGTTILLASHVKEDIQVLCDEIYQVSNHHIERREEI